jgi:hypothetical protein
MNTLNAFDVHTAGAAGSAHAAHAAVSVAAHKRIAAAKTQRPWIEAPTT